MVKSKQTLNTTLTDTNAKSQRFLEAQKKDQSLLIENQLKILDLNSHSGLRLKKNSARTSVLLKYVKSPKVFLKKKILHSREAPSEFWVTLFENIFKKL